MCLESQSFRSEAHKLGANPQTIVNWIDEYVAKTSRTIYVLRKKRITVCIISSIFVI